MARASQSKKIMKKGEDVSRQRISNHVATDDNSRHCRFTKKYKFESYCFSCFFDHAWAKVKKANRLLLKHTPPTSPSGIAAHPQTPRRSHRPRGCVACSSRLCLPLPQPLLPDCEKLPTPHPWESDH